MLIGGYQKLTLIDFPGHLATTVFTVGCNFRCPFCHNPELVKMVGTGQCPVPTGKKIEKEFFEFLKKRKGKIEGICITGGEPTLQPDLIEFIKKIKKLGFLVKLDTNGARPDVLKKIIDQKLADYIAMDIKNQPKKYLKTIGLGVETCGVETPRRVGASLRGDAFMVDRIKLSFELIMRSKIPYEFRTTVVPGMHNEKDFLEIAKWIHGAQNYYLQEYREQTILDKKLKQKTKGKKINLENIKKLIEKDFGKVGIRS